MLANVVFANKFLYSCHKHHMMRHLSLIFLPFVLLACDNAPSTEQLTAWKTEIITIETQFDAMAQKKGLEKAFEFYAAEDGAIRRGKKVITGKSAIADWYAKDVQPNEKLTWKPTFVDVSSAGDMAYTYGDYVFSSTDSLGVKKESKGIFHTVWKRQLDGSWRFVYD